MKRSRSHSSASDDDSHTVKATKLSIASAATTSNMGDTTIVDSMLPTSTDHLLTHGMPTFDELRHYIGLHGREIRQIWEHFQPVVTRVRSADFERMLLATAVAGRKDGNGAFYLKAEQLDLLDATTSSSQFQAPEFPTHEELRAYIASQPDGRIQQRKLLKHYKHAIVARDREFFKLVADVATLDGEGFIKLKSYNGLGDGKAMLIH